MKLEYLLVVAVIVGLGLGTMYSFYSQLLDTSGMDTTEAAKFNKVDSKLASVNNLQQDMKSSVTEGAIDEGSEEDSMLGDMYSSVRSKPYRASDILGNATQELGSELKTFLPASIFNALAVILGILTVFAVLYFLRGIKND